MLGDGILRGRGRGAPAVADRGLSEASGQSSSLQAARLAVLALFFLIEILPVTVKFLLNMGPLSAYEVVARLADDERIEAATTRRIEARRLEEAGSQARVSVQADMRWREEDLGRHVNRQVAAAAEERRIFVNAVDDPANASAFLSGVIRREGVTIAISTSGDAPGLTALIRQGLDELLPLAAARGDTRSKIMEEARAQLER